MTASSPASSPWTSTTTRTSSPWAVFDAALAIAAQEAAQEDPP